MDFDKEWAQIKAGVDERQNAGMQLAGSGSNARGPGRLHVTSKLLRDRAADAEKVAKAFGKADNAAIKETGEVKSGLSGFKSAAAFATFVDRWEGQVRYVKSLLGEGLADALRNTASAFDTTDLKEKKDMDKVGASEKPGDRRE
ncbi:type VII secretion target [Streptomyces iconiensis]|uniref:Type VII secretion target n=1 Tax=Streptomyces iconiensis TaxID=1384038 RepID=A0ABT7A529_9ACTN|nr:type VII secretion target [Streptomyces iconiensis]MDJ1136458.1 type VII secretion target [Streptomyces iconiensis]